MAVERKWAYEGPARQADADGATCVFCGRKLVEEHQPASYVLKAVEDDPDTDYPVEYGFAHRQCHADRDATQSRGRFELPEVPGMPGRGKG